MNAEFGNVRERHRFHVFGSLCLLVFLINFGRIVFAPLLEPFMRAFGVGEATVGLVATLAWLGSALSRLPTGYLLTRFRRQTLVLVTGLLLAVTATATSFSLTIWHVGIGAFVLGLASGMYFISANPLISELYPNRVGRVVGIHGMSAQLAAVVAPISIGAVLVLSSWRLVFVALGVSALVVTALLNRSAERADMPAVGRGERHLRESVANQWPIILTGVALIGATGFVWNGFFNFFVRYLITTKGIEFGIAQTLLTTIFAAGVPAFFLTGWIADRVPYVPLLLIILGSFILTLLAMTIAEGLLSVAIVSVIMGYVIHSLFPAIDTYLLDSLPDQDRSSAYSAYSAMVMLIQAPASVIIGLLVQSQIPFDTIYRVFAGGLVVILLVLLVLRAGNRLPDAAR